MNLQTILVPMVRLLEQKHISYAIIGGYAVAAWGELRATHDVDFLCGVQDLAVLKPALKGSGYVLEHRTGDSEDPISDVIRIEVGSEESPYEIDVIAGIRGAPPGLLQRARVVRFAEVDLKIAGPEDMIILKLLGGSPLDIKDARGILRVQKDRIDPVLLRQICPPNLGGALDGLLLDTPAC